MIFPRFGGKLERFDDGDDGGDCDDDCGGDDGGDGGDSGGDDEKLSTLESKLLSTFPRFGGSWRKLVPPPSCLRHEQPAYWRFGEGELAELMITFLLSNSSDQPAYDMNTKRTIRIG